MPRNLTDENWDLLLTRIKTGKCTPFLGAGANYGLLSGGGAIAQKWAQEHQYPLSDGSDLAKVAQYLAIRYGDPVWPKDAIRQILISEKASLDLSKVLRAEDSPLAILAQLPIPVYITTNYDDLMSHALTLQGKRPQAEMCRWNQYMLRWHKSLFSRGSRYMPSAAEPLVFHLHGHQDKVESLVLTEDDYLDFLISMSKQQDDLLPSPILEAITGTSLLFIGYRLADLNFRVLFRGLVNSMEGALRRISVAVQLPPADTAELGKENAQRYLDQYFGNAQVRVYWGTAAEFTKDLHERWEFFNK
jgi:hypothetical protein